MNRCALAHRLWLLSCRRANSRFRAALRDPRGAQQNILQKIIHENQNTQIGRRLGFEKIDSVQAFRDAVPVCTYDDLQHDIDKIAAGEQNVLTKQRVTHLISTSGSSGAVKLIPYTTCLQRQFNAAIAPWMIDLHTNWPELKHGPAYWSVSPAFEPALKQPSVIPIGFEDDTAYLGGLARRIVNTVMAVPNSVRKIQDIEEFRYVTLWWLIQARDLRLVSVWHPSFWTLLLDALPGCWDRLLSDLSRGTCTLSTGQIVHRTALKAILDLENASPTDSSSLWPNLKLISAWGDAAATPAIEMLKETFPGVHVQPKGIISTEAFLSLPYAGKRPAAVASHFIELMCEDGSCIELPDAQTGVTYRPVVTTAGGLYRYCTGDRVRVEDMLLNCPTFELLGRTDKTLDICGEKLTEAFVQAALHRVLSAHQLDPVFAMLAPADTAAPTYLELFLSKERHTSCSISAGYLAEQFDRELCENVHYAYARKLKQLGPLRLQWTDDTAHHIYLQRVHRETGTLGATKPTMLSGLSRWGRHLCCVPSSSD